MPRFKRTRGRNEGPRRSSPRGSSFEDHRRNKRDSGRGFSRGSKNRRDNEMTRVTCSSCGDKCEVPFKPTSNKPMFCDKCFSKQDKKSSQRNSSNSVSEQDLDIINEKLNKIMKALKIK